MRSDERRRKVWRMAAITVSLSVVVACGSDDDDSTGGDTTDVTTTSGQSTVVDVTTTAPAIADDVDPDKVVLASILLTVGDVDIALADGLVTAEEVDAAAAALSDGSLSEWVSRAGG